MDSRNLKIHAPRLCETFDRIATDAGRPDMRIGGDAWRREARGTETIPDALLFPLGAITQELMDGRDRAEKRGELTPAERTRVNKLVKRANALERHVYACDRIGFWH